MPITLLDGILLAFTLVSAILAMVRGFSREILSIVSWVAAAAAAFFLYPLVLPYLQPYIDSTQVAIAASAGIVFLVALILVSVVTMRIADFIIDSRVGALDRTLGFVYGAARGILVVAVALLFFTWLVGDKAPAWVQNAKSRPLLESVGNWIEGAMPDDPENSILKRLTPDQDGPDAEPGTPPADTPPADAPLDTPADAPPVDAPAPEAPPADGAPAEALPADPPAPAAAPAN